MAEAEANEEEDGTESKAEAAGEAGGARSLHLPPAAAATRLGYEDCNATGSFALDSATGARTPVSYAPHEALSPELARTMVPYESLRAFETSDGRGWGACCASAIGKGEVIVEAVG